MGHPVQTFAGIVTNPMVTHKFEIAIPGISNPSVPLITESTTFPAQGAFGEITLWFQGFKIVYPTLPANGGRWEFTIPEAANGIVTRTFFEVMQSFYDQTTGVLKPNAWKNIEIFAKDISGENIVFDSVLHGAWLAQKNPVNLSGANPNQAWKNTYVWVYQWIEDKLVGNSVQFTRPV